jgi:hypothetical protein
MTPLNNIQLAVEIRKEEHARYAREADERAAELLPQREQIARKVVDELFDGFVDHMANGGSLYSVAYSVACFMPSHLHRPTIDVCDNHQFDSSIVPAT